MRLPALALVLLAACHRPSAPPPARPPANDPDACLHRVLREAGLNEFGDPPGTMYAGGSPLFDEATGRRTSLRDYVRRRHPELAAKCP